MARRTKLTVPETPPPVELSPGVQDLQEDDEGDELDYLALSDESYRDVTWYVYRLRIGGEPLPAGTHPTAPKYVTRLPAPLDIEQLREKIGGGVFRLVGYRKDPDTNRYLRVTSKTVELEGPLKIYPTELVPPAPLVPTQPTGSPASNGTIEQLLASFVQRLDSKLETTLKTSGSAGAAGGLGVPQLLDMVMRQQDLMMKLVLEQRHGESPDRSAFHSFVDVFNKGLETGRVAEGGVNWPEMVKELTPLADKFLNGLIAGRRGRPVPPRPAPSAVPAGAADADLITPEQHADEMRWGAAVDAMARAIADGVEPADFVPTLEMVLSPQQVAMLRLATDEQVLERLGPVTDRYQILGTEQAAAYLSAVLAELRSPPQS